MSEVGKYDHLNPITLDLNLDELAEKIVKSNYGTHRLLSALIRAEKKNSINYGTVKYDIVLEIEKLLDKGYF